MTKSVVTICFLLTKMKLFRDDKSHFCLKSENRYRTRKGLDIMATLGEKIKKLRNDNDITQ